jgi:L,D-peptidoglycan transpeptidase YkuD (ErfK/YbiS/YcfS/YnhG family)
MHVRTHEIQKVLWCIHNKNWHLNFHTELEATKSHGQYARVGFNYQSSASRDQNLFELPGSGSAAIADIIDNSNVGTLGVYIYRVDVIIGFSNSSFFQIFHL